MLLTDLSVKRPVFASVISLLLIAFGLVAFDKLPLREYPNIDPPVVSVRTDYVGANAAVVESRITQKIEDRVSGVEGIRFISSSSSDGRSNVTLTFDVSRDIDSAANDVRDKIGSLLNNLPEEASPPEVQKANSSSEVIMWLNLVSDRLSIMELTDFAKRYIEDKLSVLSGVSEVRLGGGKQYALRVWIDRSKLAARGLTVSDVESALKRENLELPAGSLQSNERHYTLRIARNYRTEQDFATLVLGKGQDGYLIKLGDVARIELGSTENRIAFRGNTENMIGLGISKQSVANTLEVARLVNAKVEQINQTLPEGMIIKQGYDGSKFIEASVKEVYQTLFVAISLVIIVIYLFLGSARAMLIPAITVPVSLMGTFIVLYALGYTLNLLTLLALILAIGMVVDDAIVMLENIHRRIDEGEPKLKAAFLGAREVGFAVIATTLVLISVFMPITFLEGDLGRLFKEFAITMSSAVAISSLVALTLSPMLCSKVLKRNEQVNGLTAWIDKWIVRAQRGYQRHLTGLIKRPMVVMALVMLSLVAAYGLSKQIPQTFTPKEDRGSMFVMINGPQGASFDFMTDYINEVEARLMPMVERGDIRRLLIRAPRSFGNASNFNDGMAIIVLEEWGKRPPADVIIKEIRQRLSGLSAIRVFPVMRQSFGRGVGNPIQFVLGGPDFESLKKWRDIVLEQARKNPNLVDLDSDYKETKPQMLINIDRERAADLGVSISEIGKTLETMLGSRKVTTFMRAGEEYNVIVEGERTVQNSPDDISNIYVRSRSGDKLIPLASVITMTQYADAKNLNRYNRLRSITISGSVAPGYSLGKALEDLNTIVKTHLPAEASVSYKGASLDYQESGDSVLFIFVVALLVVFLVLAAQFESYIHPLVIMLSVPLAILGALIGLYVSGETLNIYSQIGIIMLVGLAAKNGILIVEFANQLRDRGQPFEQALLMASSQRLRPILMTGITTAIGALPLVFATGAGSETRHVIGVVVLFGTVVATLFTLYVIPAAYSMLARKTSSPLAVSQKLAAQLKQ